MAGSSDQVVVERCPAGSGVGVWSWGRGRGQGPGLRGLVDLSLYTTLGWWCGLRHDGTGG